MQKSLTYSEVVVDTLGELSEVFNRFYTKIRIAYEKRKNYVTTRDELYSLDDNMLRDLGISRYEIDSLAYELAYGKQQTK